MTALSFISGDNVFTPRKTKIIVGHHHQPQNSLIFAGLVLGVVILVVPRLLLPSRTVSLQPMVPQLGLTALKLSVLHRNLSLRYTRVTLEQYRQLQSGAPLSAVESLLGVGMEVRTQPVENGAISITYEWRNLDGSRLIVTFQDMKLTGKAQAGLR